jgi:4'-phosphopantetheinyl transferase EntD
MFKDLRLKRLNSSLKEFITLSFFTSQKHELPLHKLALPNHQFSPKRLVDFSTGRYCATKALEQMGIKDVIIPIGDEREPIWPEGIVGSISHCDTLVGAIVAYKTDHISLGLDIEEVGRVTPDLWDLVFTENEKVYLRSLTGRKLEEHSTAIFSIKEAFYKFQHPLTKTFLDFLDVEVSLPTFEQIIVLVESVSQESLIRKNKADWFVEKDCIISIITKDMSEIN